MKQTVIIPDEIMDSILDGAIFEGIAIAASDFCEAQIEFDGKMTN